MTIWKFLSGLIAIVALPCYGEVLRLSDPVEVGAGYEVFGAPMTDKSSAPGLQSIVDRAPELDGETVRISTHVAQVCQKKGCFFIATEGETWARVTFRDYEFFVPTDSAGKRVILEGEFSQRILSEEEAAHYAADLGDATQAAALPGREYSIVATSVLIPAES